MKYNVRDIFLEKSYTDCRGETIPRGFSKKLKLSISVNQWFKTSTNSLYYKSFIRKHNAT